VVVEITPSILAENMPTVSVVGVGYTDLVFALFDVLGMQFSPRLRDLGDRQLYTLKTDASINTFAI
jgi:hypothetical protein